MRAETILELRALEQVPWFRNTGMGKFEEVVRVTSWLEAVAACASLKWQNTQQRAGNRLAAAVQTVSWDQHNRWNEILKIADPIIDELLKRDVDPILQTQAIPSIVLKRVRCDLQGFALETEFNEIVEPGFFSRLADYYRRGHFPCGWEGEYPQGRLILF